MTSYNSNRYLSREKRFVSVSPTKHVAIDPLTKTKLNSKFSAPPNSRKSDHRRTGKQPRLKHYQAHGAQMLLGCPADRCHQAGGG